MATYLLPRGTCAGCGDVVDMGTDGTPLAHTIEVYTGGNPDAADWAPCPGNDHPVKELPPEGFNGVPQRLPAAKWTRLSGSGDPGVEVFVMLDGRVCTRPVLASPQHP